MDYEFEIEGLTALEVAALETKLPVGSIQPRTSPTSERHHSLIDPSILVSVAHGVLPALATWLATRRGYVKVTRKTEEGSTWTFELGVGGEASGKSAKDIETALGQD